MKSQQKLERWAEQELRRNLHTMIIDDDHGGYVAFGRYYLKPSSQAFEVYGLDDNLLGAFSDKRTAISWCVAEKHRRMGLAHEIANLDAQKQSIGADIHCAKLIAERGKNKQFVETVLTKLQPKIQQQISVNQQLEKCINLAKYLQLKGFQNETARTGHNQANYTNSQSV